jgi:hypothetical protein
MNKNRILSYVVSQKVNEVEIDQGSIAQWQQLKDKNLICKKAINKSRANPLSTLDRSRVAFIINYYQFLSLLIH